jgi:hypothetical protein
VAEDRRVLTANAAHREPPLTRRPPPPADEGLVWDDLPVRPARDLDLNAPDDEDTDPWASAPVDRRSASVDLDAPGDDDVALEPDEVERTRPEQFDLADEPVILPWYSAARIDGRELSAVLDPTRARSTWTVVGAASATSSVEVQLGGRAFRLDLIVTDGPAEELRLGRDALAGRVWVSS